MNAQVGDQWRISRAERIRQAMGSEFCAVADALRSTFGAIGSLDWLRTPALNLGTEIECEPIGEKVWRTSRKGRP